MFLNTNSLIKDVREVMSGLVEYEQTEDKPIHKYNHQNILQNAKVNVKIFRLLTLNNFFDGYIWVLYSYETVENDKDFFPSSSNIMSRWKIHKENGKWEIVDIKESP